MIILLIGGTAWLIFFADVTEWPVFVVLTLELVGAYFIFKRYVNNSFDLTLTEEQCICKYSFGSRTLNLDYSELISVEFLTGGRGTSASNVFKFQNEKRTIKLRTEAIASGEDFVKFIFWLKTKNPNFKTFAPPESKIGSQLYQALHPEQFPK